VRLETVRAIAETGVDFISSAGSLSRAGRGHRWTRSSGHETGHEPMNRSVCRSAREGGTARCAQQLAAEFGAACAVRGMASGLRRRGPRPDGRRRARRRAAGGEVPGHHAEHLMRPEHAAADLGTLVIVDTLAERKQRMTAESDLFVAIRRDRNAERLIEMLR